MAVRRRVHISNKTLGFLDGAFETERAYGEKREEMLRAANITTYFITKIIKPVGFKKKNRLFVFEMCRKRKKKRESQQLTLPCFSLRVTRRSRRTVESWRRPRRRTPRRTTAT